MLRRLMGAIVFWAAAAVCGYGAYKIIDMIISGVQSANWLMVIAGGILGYLFGALLVICAISLAVLGLIILAD